MNFWLHAITAKKTLHHLPQRNNHHKERLLDQAQMRVSHTSLFWDKIFFRCENIFFRCTKKIIEFLNKIQNI